MHYGIPLPYDLMIHTLDHYSATYTQSGAEKTRVLTLTNDDVACNFQPAPWQIVNHYKQREKEVSAVAFLLNPSVHDAIAVNDRIVHGGANYRVVGTQDLMERGKVFRIDLVGEVA